MASMKLGGAVTGFCDRWLHLSNRSPKTVAAYRADLRQFEAALGGTALVSEIDRTTVETWLSALRSEGYTVASVRRKLASLRCFLRYCIERGEIEKSPIADMRVSFGHVSRLPRVVSGEQLIRMLATLQAAAGACQPCSVAGALAKRDHAIIRVLSATGIRVAELCALSVEDYLETESALRVFGKGSRERLAMLTMDEDRACVTDCVVERHWLDPKCDNVFLNVRGTALSTEGVRGVLRRATVAAGLPCHVTPHMLRHTAATRLLEHGADLRVVQTYLGHASVRSTERYTHVSNAHLRSVLERCHPLRPAA